MTLPLERCAEMRAEMDAGRLRDEVLARAGVAAEAWTVAQRAWLDKMGAELELGRYELTNRYTRAFLDRQRALAAPPPPPLAPVALPGGEAGGEGVEGVEPARVGSPSPGARSLPDVPSYERGSAPPPLVPLPAQVLPIADAAPFSSAPLTQRADPDDETMQPRPSPLRDALPFLPTAPGAPRGEPAPAPPRPIVAPLPKPSPAAMAALGGTVVGTLSPFASVLPFASAEPTPAKSPPKPPPAPPPPPPRAATPAAPPPPPSQPAAPAAAAAAAAPLLVEGLTLEQHASLCAEMAHTPAWASTILGRYRVTPEAKAGMDQAWKARFTADPSLERRWHEAYRLYFAFLSSARRPV
jgi:hypothetical protein